MKSDFKKNSVDIQTIFSTTTKKSIFPHKAPFKNLMFVWGDSVEKPKLLLLPSWSRKSETTKRLLFLFSFRWSNSYFSLNWDLRTQNKVPIKQFSFVEEDSVEKTFVLIYASYSSQCENWKKMLFSLFSLDNQTCISPPLKVLIPQSRSQFKGIHL